MKTRLALAVFTINILRWAGAATAQESLAEQLKPLQPFIGKTWRGEFKNSTPDKPVVDVSRWERALNGQAVRVLHSINNGEYGGETIIFWDKQKQSLVYYYFTTAGFFTHGSFKLEQGKFISHEYVTGNAEGVTEVKATGEMTPDGKMISTSQYFKNGEWVEGHSAVYIEDSTAQVVFK